MLIMSRNPWHVLDHFASNTCQVLRIDCLCWSTFVSHLFLQQQAHCESLDKTQHIHFKDDFIRIRNKLVIIEVKLKCKGRKNTFWISSLFIYMQLNVILINFLKLEIFVWFMSLLNVIFCFLIFFTTLQYLN